MTMEDLYAELQARPHDQEARGVRLTEAELLQLLATRRGAVAKSWVQAAVGGRPATVMMGMPVEIVDAPPKGSRLTPAVKRRR